MLKSLLQLCFDANSYPQHRNICYRDNKTVTWAELQRETQQWQQQLVAVQDQKIAVYFNNGLDLITAIFAIWQLGKTAIIPANALAATIDIIGKETSTFVGDFGEKAFTPSPSYQQKLTPRIETDIALILFTSGSSGQPKPINKTFAQLNAELALLENQWGSVVKNSLFLGTVSHHHMFGLPFRLLWPLASGRMFVSRELDYLEQLEKWTNSELSFITSPAHLEHLPQVIDWPAIRTATKNIFAAGAPLSEDSAKNCFERFSSHVTEIYGSTETGAVAWQQQLKYAKWKAISGVEVGLADLSQHLRVKTPAVSQAEWIETSDRCEITDKNNFTLNGRSDRIVKVAGKRVSLTFIESQLQNHPWVDAVKLVFLAEKKSRIGAVIQLNAQGNAELIDKGKREINTLLTETLSSSVEAVAIPRYWRYISRLPVDKMGKTTTQILTSLFFPEQQPTLPDIIQSSIKNNSATNSSVPNDEGYLFTLRVPENLYYFSGHFPGRAVLPGVVQVTWVNHFARLHFKELGPFLRLEAVKFQQIITAGQTVHLSLTHERKKSRLTFNYHSENANYSSGRMIFSDD